MTYLNTYNSRRNALNWPANFGSLEKQLDSLLAGFPGFFDNSPSEGGSSIKVRWYESEEGYLARLDLPGVSKEDISLELEDGYLQVAATRKFAEGNDSDASLDYKKSFKVPDEVEAAKVSARYEDGVLSLSLPKGEKAKPRQIQVG